MKHILLVAIIIGLGILTRAESEYEVSSDGTSKILKGLISRELLQQEPSFTWFNNSRLTYIPDSKAVATLKAKGSQAQLLVFAGTWNPETQLLLPRFYALLDAASIPEKQLTLIGVDRDKNAFNHLSEDLHITQLPTFIVMKNGKEMGRVVEFGNQRQGNWENQLADIIDRNF